MGKLDINLNSLVTQYCSENVVPILGCELFKINTNTVGTVNIHDYIIHESFQPTEEWPLPPKFLSELQFSNSGFNQNNVIGILNEINEKQKNVDLLTKMALLRHFKVFIIASFYKEFEDEFRAVNPGEEIEIFKNSLSGNHNLNNIDFNNGKRKIIYLFDNIDNAQFALNDEELLESVFGLASAPTAKTNNSLPSALANKTLLFIGCDFSDWFMRYCIRVLYNKPFDKPQRTYIINDSPSKLNYQEFFFKKHSIYLLHSSPVDKFITDFYELAIKKHKFVNKFENSRVFIAYQNEDTKTAQKLSNHLRNFGIDTWLDEEDKKVGEHIPFIKKTIYDSTTKMMVSIISKTLIDSLVNKKSYVRDVEWDTAIVRIKAAEFNNKEDKFSIIPYYVDDPHDYPAFDHLPDLINREFRFGTLFGGFEKLVLEIEKKLHNGEN